MQYSNVHGPVWADPDHTAINCMVTFEGLGEVPYTASPTDSVVHSRAIFAAAADGQFGAVAPYVAPAPGPQPVPRLVTMRQARLALLGAGMLSGVDAVIDAMPSPQKEAARIEWEYAATVERQSPLVDAISAALDLNSATLDALFAAAAAI